jgi:hypothetical protein
MQALRDSAAAGAPNRPSGKLKPKKKTGRGPAKAKPPAARRKAG